MRLKSLKLVVCVVLIFLASCTFYLHNLLLEPNQKFNCKPCQANKSVLVPCQSVQIQSPASPATRPANPKSTCTIENAHEHIKLNFSFMAACQEVDFILNGLGNQIHLEADRKFSEKRLQFVKETTSLIKIHSGPSFVEVTTLWRPSPFVVENGTYQCKTKSPCSWKVSHQFFHYEAAGPQINDSHLQKLKFILIDFHGGPLLDTLGFLIAMGVPKTNIRTVCGPIGVHCQPADTSPDLQNLLQYLPGCGGSIFDTAFANVSRAQQLLKLANPKLPLFDVMICMYPGYQCAFAALLAKTVIIRFAMRWQECLSLDANKITVWGGILRKMASCPNIAISATNGMDHQLLHTELGIKSLPWPSLALLKKPNNFTQPTSQWDIPQPKTTHLLHTHLQPYFSDSLAGHIFWWLTDASKGGTIFQLDHAHFSKTPFQDYAAILVLPYNIQVTKVVEYYMSGVPLIAPSFELLTFWHQKYKACRHRTPNLQPDRDSNIWNYSKVPEASNAPCCASSPQSAEDAHVWLAMSDFYHWPNVTYFSTRHELQEAFLKLADRETEGVESRNNVIRSMFNFKRTLFERSAGILKSQLSVMLAAEEAGSACNFQDLNEGQYMYA